MHPLLDTLQRRNRLVHLIESLSDLGQVDRAEFVGADDDFRNAEVRVHYPVSRVTLNGNGGPRYRPARGVNFNAMANHIRHMAKRHGATTTTRAPAYSTAGSAGVDEAPLRAYRRRPYVRLTVFDIKDAPSPFLHLTRD